MRRISKNISKKIGKIVLVSGLAAIMLGALTGCVNAINYTYQNADKYTAGDRTITDKIDKIDIDYLSGDIKFDATETDAVAIKETTNKTIDDKMKVHSWVNEGTLYVRFCTSGKRMDFTNIDKNLEITIPADTNLNELKVEISSGSFTGKGINADSVNVTASSGDIDVNGTADKINLVASSGDIKLTQKGDSSEVEMEASSGHVTADVENINKVDVTTSSGDVVFNGKKIKEVNATASSGEAKYTFDEAPGKSSFTSSSGDIKIYVPEKSDITVVSTHSSGEFDDELPFGKEGEKYVCGSGTNKMDITTSSGDQKILKLKSGE